MTALKPYCQGVTIKYPGSSADRCINANLSVPLPPSSILHEYMFNQIFTQNSNFIVLVTGMPGAGKSVSSAGILERWSWAINKPFTIRYNVVHGAGELINRIAEIERRFNAGEDVRGTALQLDDAGVSMDSRNWYENIHKLLNDSVEVMRYLGLVLFITVPNKDRLDKKMRDLAHASLDIKKKREGQFTLAKFYITGHNWRTGDYMPTLLRAASQGWTFQVKAVRIKPPSLALRREYAEFMYKFKGGIIQKSASVFLNKNRSVVSEKQPLTERQRQVYFMVNGGTGADSVAHQLGISLVSVKAHVNEIRRKGWL